MRFSLVRSTLRWIIRTPERSVDEAFKAALAIAKLEREYFQGETISPIPTNRSTYSENTLRLLLAQLRNELSTIEMRLAEYRTSTRIPYLLTRQSFADSPPLAAEPTVCDIEPSLLQKLDFIDFIREKYKQPPPSTPVTAAKTNAASGESEASSTPQPELTAEERSAPMATQLAIANQPNQLKSSARPRWHQPKQQSWQSEIPVTANGLRTPKSKKQRSPIPSGILETIARIGKDLTTQNPLNSASQAVAELSQTRLRTVSAFKFVGLLVVVAIATQLVARHLVFGPLVDYLQQEQQLFVQAESPIRETTLQEFVAAKEKLEFQKLLGKETTISAEEWEERLREETQRIEAASQEDSLRGSKNGLADLAAIAAVYLVLVLSKQQVAVLKASLKESWWGLGDSAQAFLIIAATDTFVGYHSAEGWEALLTTLEHHLGLAENQMFILGFIAIVPVGLDAMFKFWIFQYLRTVSPTTSAIYEQMNR
jgi:hypothetical protein